jgi:hypothetical protein
MNLTVDAIPARPFYHPVAEEGLHTATRHAVAQLPKAWRKHITLRTAYTWTRAAHHGLILETKLSSSRSCVGGTNEPGLECQASLVEEPDSEAEYADECRPLDEPQPQPG